MTRALYIAANIAMWAVVGWTALLTAGSIALLVADFGGSKFDQGFSLGLLVWLVPKALFWIVDTATDPRRGRG